jgi:hypothetical protein
VISLALALVMGGGRRAAIRLLLIVAGVSAGVVLVLGALAIGPARDRQDARQSLRTSPPAAPPADIRPALLWDANRAAWSMIGDRIVAVVEVAQTAAGAPRPLGAPRTPAAGEVFVSPALRDLLGSSNGRVYRLRFPGRIAGTLGQDVLHDPRELVAMVGLPASALAGAPRVTDWNGPRPADAGPNGNTFNRRLVYLLVALGILVPIGVFVAASTRVGASTRELRFAAMRLVGATPGQVATAAALEAAAAGFMGVLAGLVAAVGLRTRAMDITIGGYAAFPSDLTVPLWQVAALAVATPLLAAAAALMSMRRVIVTPLGVRRRRPPGRPSALRLVPLALAWAELVWAVNVGDGLGGQDGKLVALGAGFAGVILGIVIAGSWLVGALASGFARLARGPGGLIAGRRLQAAPSTAFRAVGGAVLGVFAATAVLVFLPSQERWVAAANGAASSVPPPPVDATVNVYGPNGPPARPDQLSFRLARIPGVRLVLPVKDIERRGYGGSALFGNCADAGAVLHLNLTDCPAGGVLVDRASGLNVGDRFQIGSTEAVVSGFIQSGRVMFVVPPGVASAPPHPDTWLLATDGRLETAERIRAAQTGSGLQGNVETAAADTVRHSVHDPLRRQAQLAVALMLSIAGCSLAVMMIEGIMERRRELAMLAAAGTRPRDLRWATALEVLIPLAVASIASCVIGVLVTATVLQVRGIALVVPWADLGRLLAMTVVVAAAVLAIGLPMLGRVIRADTLRTE